MSSFRLLTQAALCVSFCVLGALTTSRAQTPSPEAAYSSKRQVFAKNEIVTFQIPANLPNGAAVARAQFDISELLPQIVEAQNGEFRYRFDASLLREGNYQLRIRFLASDGGNVTLTRPITIAPPLNPQRMPVWNWAGANTPNLVFWRQHGFTGLTMPMVRDALLTDSQKILTARILDEGTRLNLDIGAYFHPLLSQHWAKKQASEARLVLIDGSVDSTKPYPLAPVVLNQSAQLVENWSRDFAAFPSWRHALLSSEYDLPFVLNAPAIEDAKRATGLDLPSLFRLQFLVGGSGSKQKFTPSNRFVPANLPREWQPKAGLIEDDNPIYRILQWWWQRGNGLAPFNARLAHEVKTLRPDVLVWHDPYRLAPVYQTEAGLDAVSTWTYAYPDIKRLAYTTVLQAAARPEKQKVMQTITLFVYGRFVQPTQSAVSPLWKDSPGQEPFFTQGPDYTREAIWLTLSQRPDILGFYQASSLSPNNPKADKGRSSPETFDAIGEEAKTLIEPYGPAILQSRREKARVAVLMSAAALWFSASKPQAGYPNEAILPYCALLMMNHVPFEVILDDDIAAGRLREFEALLIPRGDTLRRSDAAKIAEFSRQGHPVLADSSLRALLPGATLLDFDFSFQNALDGTRFAAGNAITADAFRARNEALAQKLAPFVAPLRAPSSATANSPRVLLNTLESGSIAYVFAINDDKTYGPRFGAAKLFHERGIPQKAQITFGRPREVWRTGAVYDALNCTRIPTNDGTIHTTLPAARGKLFAVLPEPIGAPNITAPAFVKREQKLKFSIEVRGQSGALLEGTIPLKIEVLDATGHLQSSTRFGATQLLDSGWQLRETLPIALNDTPGNWKLRVTELLSGLTRETSFVVN